MTDHGTDPVSNPNSPSAPPVQGGSAHEPFYALDTGAALAALDADARCGLTAEEAARRLAEYGPNKLAEKPPVPKWKVFLSQFKDFMIYILLAAVIIAAIEGQLIEAVAILVILLLNGVLGFIQERRAGQALEALKRMSAPAATVLRSGVEQHLPTAELAPGDIVYLEAGNTVPADGRLLEVGALRCVESALTGESVAVRKTAAALEGEHAALGDQENMVFSGTTVSAGRGSYVVTSTGQATEMGKIATLLNETEEGETPLQQELERVGKRIGLVILVIAILVFIEEVVITAGAESGGLLQMFTHPSFRAGITEALLVAIALAVAAIPEGLPAIVTVSLSLGVRRMAEKHAIMKRLHAVETLGSTTFICSDKTGTLTLNQMTVRKLLVGTQVVTVEGSELIPETDSEASTPDVGCDALGAPLPAGTQGVGPTVFVDTNTVDPTPCVPGLRTLLTIAAGCNDAHYTADQALVGDPTETALIACVHDLAPDLAVAPRVAEIPFDSDRKRMSTTHSRTDGDGQGAHDAAFMTYVKGGMDTTLPCCTHALIDGAVVELDEELRERIVAANTSFAEGGLRTLAFALREHAEPAADVSDVAAVESGLTYVGLMAEQDPARPEVPVAVKTAQEAGIQIAMVTGDHALTARAIATEIGIMAPDQRVVTGAEIERMSDEELAAAAPDIRVYARVNPEHKIRIVSALKARGHVVAMTGDGVNDAPALKRADIGVAMGVVGTDVTREAADMVLADDNFSTIVHAVEEGRTVFANLKKVILFLLSCNIAEVLIVAITSFFSFGAGLLPLQLLWINLITDGLPALALGVDPAEHDAMRRKPRNASKPILTLPRWMQIFSQGAVMTVAALILAYVVAPLVESHAPGLAASNAYTTRTMLFAGLVLAELLHTLTFRSETKPVFSAEVVKNKWLLAAIAGSFALQFLVIYVPGLRDLFQLSPLSALQWGAVLAVAFIAMVINDLIGLVIDKKMSGRE